MTINNMVNAALIVAGILQYLGMLGGLGFLVWFLVDLYRIRPLSEKEKQKRCESCSSYETCAAVMQDCLPDFACAYWQKKKP